MKLGMADHQSIEALLHHVVRFLLEKMLFAGAGWNSHSHSGLMFVVMSSLWLD